MNMETDLSTKNTVTVMLVQSLCGAISPNFRMVSLAIESTRLRVLFVLESESQSDRSEIEDVIGDLDALLLSLAAPPPMIDVDVQVTQLPIVSRNDSEWRTVFRRRE